MDTIHFVQLSKNAMDQVGSTPPASAGSLVSLAVTF